MFRFFLIARKSKKILDRRLCSPVHSCSQKACEVAFKVKLGNSSPDRFGKLEKDDLVAFIGEQCSRVEYSRALREKLCVRYVTQVHSLGLSDCLRVTG